MAGFYCPVIPLALVNGADGEPLCLEYVPGKEARDSAPFNTLWCNAVR